ncbi:hypothetical protein P7K49_026010 [Saguinus oedipus]|uniref:Uncharacterized protein n=1 Tax=Saguinus oedipus TaxID=9490 RepID=A0ABQ9UIV7_SAGOE|nr:hypothetical protein P7K49_026010 [Saguinus oedipus]
MVQLRTECKGTEEEAARSRVGESGSGTGLHQTWRGMKPPQKLPDFCSWQHPRPPPPARVHDMEVQAAQKHLTPTPRVSKMEVQAARDTIVPAGVSDVEVQAPRDTIVPTGVSDVEVQAPRDTLAPTGVSDVEVQAPQDTILRDEELARSDEVGNGVQLELVYGAALTLTEKSLSLKTLRLKAEVINRHGWDPGKDADCPSQSHHFPVSHHGEVQSHGLLMPAKENKILQCLT